MVTLEVLHIADCPNWKETFQRLEIAAATALSTNASLTATLIDSAEKAEATHFSGSPTILVNGMDLFPSEGRTRDLACRIYITPNGLAGAPTQEQLLEALAAHG